MSDTVAMEILRYTLAHMLPLHSPDTWAEWYVWLSAASLLGWLVLILPGLLDFARLVICTLARWLVRQLRRAVAHTVLGIVGTVLALARGLAWIASA